MKKILYMLIFTGRLLALAVLSPALASCDLVTHISELSEEEAVTVKLPDWPPREKNSPESPAVPLTDSQQGSRPDSQPAVSFNFPPLSRWLITIYKSSGSQSFYAAADCRELSFTIKKNMAASLTAQPLTRLYGGGESAYFYPAGFLYPAAVASGADGTAVSEGAACWEQGFLADILGQLTSSRAETGVSQKRLETFLNSFNWSKAQQSIEKNCQNPWLIDRLKLMDNLCYGNYKSTLLHTKGTMDFRLEELFPDRELKPLLPYIPENFVVAAGSPVKIRKNTETFIADGRNFGVIFNCKSSKNISRQYAKMPIYCERL